VEFNSSVSSLASLSGDMIANRTTSLARHVLPALVTLGLSWAFALSGAESVAVRAPLVTTNVVLVTNIVTVTNLVVTTNAVVTTNGVPASSSSSALPNLSWVPPEDRFDWIQLKSGEWLKGRIKAMQERELEFDSEELDDLTFDWKDIRQVRSPRILDVLFIDGELVSGPVAITPTEVSVGAETPRVLPRAQLQSLTPGGSKERNYWSGNLSAGLTLRSGNTEQVEYNAQAHLQRRTPATRLTLDYIGNVSRVDGATSADNHRVNSEFDRWLSRRFYLILPFAEYYKDPFQNLDFRLTGGVGAGYDLIVEPKMEWTITAGPAYQYSWFESSQPGEPTEKGAAALAFGTRFDWDITRKLELELGYRGQYTSREVGETTHHAVGTLSIDITKRFDLDVSLTWDRIARPKVGSDGVEPKPDDFRLVVGLAVDF
jgi:YD repeat-containing protein